MSCSCMYVEGVRREGQSEYVCAVCGEDCTRSFLTLLDVDEAFADWLIKLGEHRPRPYDNA